MRLRAVCLGLVCAVIGAGAMSVAAQEIHSEGKGLYATDELTLLMAMKPGEQLTIRSASTLTGTIVVRAAETEEVRVDYAKRAKADSRSRAIDYIDLIAVDLDRTADGVRLQLRAPNPAPWSTAEGGLVEVEIVVPAGVSLDIDALYFDLVATGPFSGIVVPSSLGRIEVSDVAGRCDVATANRRLTLANITGRVSAETRNSILTAVNIVSSDGQAIFRNAGGDIEIDGFSGGINVKNTYGRIELLDFAPSGRRNVIRGRSAPVIIEVTRIDEGSLILNNRMEDIDLTLPTPLSAVLSLAVEDDGKIELSHLPVRTDLVQRDRLSVVAGEGEAFISGSISGRGNIYIRGVEGGEY